LARSRRRLVRLVSADCAGEDLVGVGCESGLCGAAPSSTPAGCLACCADSRGREATIAGYSDYPAHCGDGMVSDDEACDEGLSELCDLDCSPAECGDGVTNAAAGEACDDANATENDGCTSQCELGPRPCPSAELMTVYAGTYGHCDEQTDCPVGICDESSGSCRSSSRIDRGWTGHGHGHDLNHAESRLLVLDCSGGAAGACGPCQVTGALFEAGNCRCADDSRSLCDEPFANDFDDCSGALCRCYAGAPLAFSTRNIPSCQVLRYDSAPSGSIDPDSGAREIVSHMRVTAFQGESLVTPCPYCVGDPVAGDLLRGGVCRLGENAGQACDATAVNSTFPAPGGGGASLDCMPAAGKNISGDGRPWVYRETTGTTSLGYSEEVQCGAPPLVIEPCHCGVCEFEEGRACSTSLECERGGRCMQYAPGSPLANQCDGQLCQADGDGYGVCTNGPFDSGCDGIVRANGDALILCGSNADCEPQTIGVDAGACTLSEQRKCFPDLIERTGRQDASNPRLASVSCAAVEGPAVGFFNPIGLPGPTAQEREGVAEFFCTDALTTEYIPGVGGCAE